MYGTRDPGKYMSESDLLNRALIELTPSGASGIASILAPVSHHSKILAHSWSRDVPNVSTLTNFCLVVVTRGPSIKVPRRKRQHARIRHPIAYCRPHEARSLHGMATPPASKLSSGQHYLPDSYSPQGFRDNRTFVLSLLSQRTHNIKV